MLGETEEKYESGNHHDAAADTEQPADDACNETDGEGECDGHPDECRKREAGIYSGYIKSSISLSSTKLPWGSNR